MILDEAQMVESTTTAAAEMAALLQADFRQPLAVRIEFD